MEHLTRFSRKRQAILDVMRGTKLHPSAEWVHQTLKAEYPDLSLGTVYRNLSFFREQGALKSVGVVNGQERFDACVAPHSHFVCTRCGAVLDLDGLDPGQALDARAAKRGFTVERHELTFYGACPACQQLEKENAI